MIPFSVDVQDRHHLVPLWRPAVWPQVWILDLLRVAGAAFLIFCCWRKTRELLKVMFSSGRKHPICIPYWDSPHIMNSILLLPRICEQMQELSALSRLWQMLKSQGLEIFSAPAKAGQIWEPSEWIRQHKNPINNRKTNNISIWMKHMALQICLRILTVEESSGGHFWEF